MPIDGDAYKRHFPFGIFLDAGGTGTVRDMGGSGTTINANNATGIKVIVNHPESGIKARNVPYIGWTNQQPFAQETGQNLSGTIEAQTKGGNVYQLAAPMAKPLTSAATGWDSASWFGTTYSAGFHTDAAADALAANYAPIYASHPSVLAFNIRDDVTDVGGSAKAIEAATACKAMQRADPRPCTCVYTSRNAYAMMGSELKLITAYKYPCGQYIDSVETPEGDFHRSTFSTWGAGDWTDWARDFMSVKPAGVPAWYYGQTHKTTGSSGTALRYPTAREIRKQTWTIIGEGFKGIFWFVWTDQAPTSDGLGNPTRADIFDVVSEMSGRLKPDIRKAILTTERQTTSKFTTSGGGSSGHRVNYSNAYVSTLYDAAADKYYCVLCNESTSPAAVTVTSATLTGRLRNMETGATFIIGQSVTLPALDGGIWEYDPYIGVPHWPANLDPDVESRWTNHWCNPASVNYWSSASIKHWPTEVIVSPGAGTIQAAIDANPGNYITFRLQSGTYTGAVYMSGREHIHFIADNPAARPVVNGSFLVIGHPTFRYYNGTYAPTIGSISALKTDGTGAGDPAVKAAHKNPARDFIWRNIDFDGTGLIMMEHYQGIYDTPGFTSGRWRVDHFAQNSPIFCRNTQDELVQNCTFSNTTWGWDPYDGNPVTSPAYPTPLTQPDTSGVPTRWHPGMIGGNSGVHNFCARDNTFNGSGTARGTVYGVFIDGSQGACIYNNTFTGKYNSGHILLLTNDDFTHDVDRDGRWQKDLDYRNAKYNIVAGNTHAVNGGYIISITGEQNLVTANTMAGGSTSNITYVYIATRCNSHGWDVGEKYRSYGNVISSNTITGSGTIARFVSFDADSGWCTDADPDSTKYSVIGRTVIKNNTYGGAVTKWALDIPGATKGFPTEATTTFTSNTDSGGTRSTV